MTPEDVKHWQKKMGFTYEAAADALGVNRATFGNYVKRGAPLSVALACSALAAGLKGYQMKKVITEAEALEILQNTDADDLPVRIVNESGKATIAEWLLRCAENPEAQKLDSWLSEAEASANNAMPDETIGIEMPGKDTKNGNPAVLTLEKECFDWIIIEP